MRTIDLLVLGMISEKPRHGYDITREIAARGLRHWLKVSDVAVYKACARLERQGCLVSLAEKDGKSPERCVYQLTVAGRELLSDLAFELMSSAEPIRNEYYLAFEFPRTLERGEALLALERRLESVARELAGRRARLEALSGVDDDLALSVSRREVEVYEGELAWLEELEGLVRDGSWGSTA